jgi:hypothetical protein
MVAMPGIGGHTWQPTTRHNDHALSENRDVIVTRKFNSANIVTSFTSVFMSAGIHWEGHDMRWRSPHQQSEVAQKVRTYTNISGRMVECTDETYRRFGD